MKESKKYFIPINGKLYETSEMVYKAYYMMDRRERYLEERSKKNELSYEALLETDYPVGEKIIDKAKGVDDEAVTSMEIEKMLSVLLELTDEEKWLVEELFFNGKSEVKLAKEVGIARTTLQSRKYKILEKIRNLIEE